MASPLPSARNHPFLVTTALLALILPTCGGDPVPDTDVDRETFIATYVDLRLSALGTPTGVITDAERARVLQEHAVTEEDLLSFADAHGKDPATMKVVWEEVQRRLRAAAGEDTVASGGAGG